ncbi:MAG: hypothetical protein GY714_20215 [Desulfobacterales bacterium]|nr:hypothetical protein [Desulfobacterales bacterium]
MVNKKDKFNFDQLRNSVIVVGIPIFVGLVIYIFQGVAVKQELNTIAIIEGTKLTIALTEQVKAMDNRLARVERHQDNYYEEVWNIKNKKGE